VAVVLRRNNGQDSAMAAGSMPALGEVLITLDGDLQNDLPTSPCFAGALGMQRLTT